jgi:hypothetical protein
LPIADCKSAGNDRNLRALREIGNFVVLARLDIGQIKPRPRRCLF